MPPKTSSSNNTISAKSAQVVSVRTGGRVMTRKMSKLATLSASEAAITVNPVKNEDQAVDEMALLCDHRTVDETIENHDVKTAPLFTREAYLSTGISEEDSQYGVLGRILAIQEPTGARTPEEARVYLNTNTPFSALVCGVQGAGKSHTVSVILENMLFPSQPSIGSCKKALSGLVLHFSEGGPSARPCEAAWLGLPKTADTCAPSVRVYVSNSSLSTMKKVYAPLGDNVVVRPLRFSQSELDAQAIMSMMALGSSESVPLYMHTILSILRELGEDFTYDKFLAEVERAKKDMNPHQKDSLNQRLSLLSSFVDSARLRKGRLFKEGRLTIIDLSDPFLEPSCACSLFEIVTRLFTRAELSTGKVLVVDEAHKYLSTNHGGNSGLSKALTSLIRQQRHLAMRVIIATQEPTAVPPVLIDLCSIAIFHRFTSPAWWDAVARRVCADVSNSDGFERVVRLKTGQAVVLCPSGLGLFRNTRRTASGTIVQEAPKLGQFGRSYMIIKTRQRITSDGGASVMALDA